ncbi:hypothetical protein [Amycolatopsis eburnea]|uniref:Uncharacterized protein n=1 Tax=Amycolatopsis eburnea TaxID=2267691 RepID=A0A3R9E5F7_9PSEU|nr:hypothetical protein [Amycolatopsis eburnea]RSD23841.1 hypothetical protein EIY87_05545 [Amycolatopsis eburnea]
MAEPFTMSLVWLGQAAAGAIVGRLAERAVDRVLDGPRRAVVVPAPARHRLGDVTSDVDVVVRHTPAGRRPVLLAFQTAPREGERPQGVTVPMVLGETAHLTLPRDDYLISALVLDSPAELGGKPVLHGVGWVRRWIASTGVDRLTIATDAPTQKILRKLGLQAADGTSPFELAPPKPASVPQEFPAAFGEQPAAVRATLAAQAAARAAASRPGLPAATQCRAAAGGRLGQRCPHRPFGIGGTGLCMTHYHAYKRGEAVYDWKNRRQIS